MDEASAGVRVELDSQPEAIEKLEAAVLQSEIESAALALEAKSDAAAAARLKVVAASIARKKEKLLTLRARHELQKELIANMSAIAKEVEETQGSFPCHPQCSTHPTQWATVRYGSAVRPMPFPGRCPRS